MDRRLYGCTIYVGRDPEGEKLKISLMANGKNYICRMGQDGAVPASVSRLKGSEEGHLKFAIDGDGKIILTNLKPQNATYADGVEINSKRITERTLIEMGFERYKLNWAPMLKQLADKFLPHPTVSIQPLEAVWEEYESMLSQIELAREKQGKTRMIPMMITMLLGVVSSILMIVLGPNTLFITVPITTVAFGIMLKAYLTKDKSAEKRRKAKRWLGQHYTCPNCGRYLGERAFWELKLNTERCPKCQAYFS